ncbi:MAG: hypothetical protein LKG11_00800 [Bacilli bacterium]|jgi:hypothetical protein|nr:hypothetical protein [Bacilli bacterium]
MRTFKEIISIPNLVVKRSDDVGGFFGYWTDPLTQKRWNVCFSSYGGWEHLSVSGRKTPDWDLVCRFKDMFWREDEACVEYHPRKEDYVNNCETCLHIWRPTEEPLPLPPPEYVGVKGVSSSDVSAIAGIMMDSQTPKEKADFLHERYGDNFNRKERRILNAKGNSKH